MQYLDISVGFFRSLKGLTSSVLSHKTGLQRARRERNTMWSKGGGGGGRGDCGKRKEQRVREGGGQRGKARIDHPPGVMDSAISGSGQRRRGESDFCFSKSWWMRASGGRPASKARHMMDCCVSRREIEGEERWGKRREDKRVKSGMERAGGDRGHQGKCKEEDKWDGGGVGERF